MYPSQKLFIFYINFLSYFVLYFAFLNFRVHLYAELRIKIIKEAFLIFLFKHVL